MNLGLISIIIHKYSSTNNYSYFAAFKHHFMKKITGILFGITVLVFNTFANVLPVVPISLALKPAINSKVTYVISDYGSTITSMNGLDMHSVANTTTEYTLDYIGEISGLNCFKVVLNSIKIHTEIFGMSVDINSDSIITDTSKLNSNANMIYKRLTNKPFTIFITKSGNINSTSGTKEIYQKAFIKTELNSLAPIYKNMLNERLLTSGLTKLFAYLPNKPVEVNEKWVKNDSLALTGMHLNLVTTYSLDKLNTRLADISFNSVIQYEGPNQTTLGIASTVKVSGEINGSCEVNTSTGMLNSFSSSVTTDTKMKMRETEVPMKSLSKTTIFIK